ncbi:MAG: chloride channel protein [Arenicellales bacterium]
MAADTTTHLQDAQLSGWGSRSLFAIATLIGLLAGTAAWGFRLLIGLIHNFSFFGVFSLVYDANVHTAPSSWSWLVIFIPVIGGVVVIFLIENFAPEAKGHGVPEVMDAIYYRRGRIRGVVSIVKAVASAITIGTGGSLGREGPIVQISAAFSSVFAQWLKLPMSQRNLLIACGASGGIAATFNAPLGGILFSVELLMLSVNSRTLLPVIISSVIAANVGRYLIGPDPAFHVTTTALASNTNPLILAVYFPFGAVVGLLALVFIKSVYWSENWFDNLPMNPYQRHMLGMLALGSLFYGFHELAGHYYVQGVGYATIQDIVSGKLTSLWLLLLLLGGKLLATMLTIGSGGSGGVFSPSLYLGATCGGLFGYALSAVFPGLGVDPLTLALVGMAAMVAATTSAPMTAAIMTYELTLDYVVVLPIMVGVAVAYSVRHYFSKGDIYTLKLMRRGQNVPQGLFADMNSQIIVNDIMDRAIEFVHKEDVITGSDSTCCVVDENNKVIGIINPISYRKGIQFRAQDAMLTEFIPLRSGMNLRQAFHEIDRYERVMAVVSVNGSLDADQILGVLSPFNLTRVMANASQMHESQAQ